MHCCLIWQSSAHALSCRCISDIADDCAQDNECWTGDFKVDGKQQSFSACQDNLHAIQASPAGAACLNLMSDGSAVSAAATANVVLTGLIHVPTSMLMWPKHCEWKPQHASFMPRLCVCVCVATSVATWTQMSINQIFRIPAGRVPA